MKKQIKLKRAIWKNVFNQDPRFKDRVLSMEMENPQEKIE